MYKVRIRKNSTGEERDCVMDMEWHGPDENGDRDLFWWTEGSFGCDCNRAIVFYNKYRDDYPCGFTEYTVLYVELPDSTHVPIDMEPEQDES
jgi:hypothetical protein